MKLILATHNPHKVIEMSSLLGADSGYEILSLDDLEIQEDIEETATTFEGNAALKAEWIATLTGHLALADDSGIEIRALNNEPGIYSARYLGEKTPYTIKNQIILERLEGQLDRFAQYVSVVAIAQPHQPTQTFRGEMKGQIALEAKGQGGFGYDPIFVPDGHQRSLAELTLEEKNAISHRGQSLRLALAYLKGRSL